MASPTGTIIAVGRPKSKTALSKGIVNVGLPTNRSKLAINGFLDKLGHLLL
jgi:hypothetical protein